MSESPALRGLRAMRERLAAPERWCRLKFARTKTGRGCMVDSPRAIAWSLEGAAHLAGWRAYDALRGMLGTHLCTFGDAPTTTHADILALLDRAIAAEERA